MAKLAGPPGPRDVPPVHARVYTSSMQTSMRVSAETRDALARIASDDLGGVSLDEALRVVLFEHRTAAALARLAADQALAEEYRAEANSIAEIDVAVQE